jgi:nitrogen regulatory protein PII
MAFLVVLILDDVDQCHPLLDAWEAAGARGVTMLESSGIGRVRRAHMRDDIPLLPSLQRFFQSEERHHRTLFSVVESEEQAQKLIDAAQSVVGDFSQPNTGLVFVIPLQQVVGLHKTQPPPMRPR